MVKKKADELKVFITRRKTSQCEECGDELHKGGMLFLEEEKGALCLSCADLDHLLFLNRGNTALTRRSKKYSQLWAVVLKWSQTRKQYERQGLLVEEDAVVKAEKECLEDSEVRERNRERATQRREAEDRKYREEFAQHILKHYPGCPAKRAKQISDHACRKYSGRVGRSAAAKMFGPETVKLAVTAHIRHNFTPYDVLLMQGVPRWDARDEIRSKVDEIETSWAAGKNKS